MQKSIKVFHWEFNEEDENTSGVWRITFTVFNTFERAVVFAQDNIDDVLRMEVVEVYQAEEIPTIGTTRDR